jgi:hypothetical protein
MARKATPPGRNRCRYRLAVAGLVLPVVGAALPAATAGAADAPPTTSGLQVSTQPGLYPKFDPTVTDYVTRCNPAVADTVTVTVPSGDTVSVAGQTRRGGQFTTSVQQAVDKSFTISVAHGQQSINYYVRCLPADFPTWTASAPGTPQAEYYVVAPGTYPDTVKNHYLAIFDNHGVPIWWTTPSSSAVLDELLPNGTFAWTDAGSGIAPVGTAAEVHRLDGSLVTKLVAPGAYGTDYHELLQLANGNYLVAADTLRSGVDLSFMGGPASATVIDPVLEELSPTGALQWSWDTADHISPTELDPQWYMQTLYQRAPTDPYNVYLFNSAELTPSGSGFVLSYRSLDAVYGVDKASGAISWKLGGSPTPQSLTIQNDPVFARGSHFGGQHDARMMPDGSVTMEDPGSGLGRAPRAVRYTIDQTNRTATLVEQLTDPLATNAPATGSARKLAGGDWVMAWGFTPFVTEMTPSGSRVFLLQFAPGWFTYRATPVPYGQISKAAIRAGMDAMPPS